MSPPRAAEKNTDIAVCLETGSTRVFASAFDWPGWARSAKTADEAIEHLDAYRDRYRVALAASGLEGPGDGSLSVVARVKGSGTTDFGAPGHAAPSEDLAVDEVEAARLVSMVAAGWAAFDAVAGDAPPVLRKGPRGGGRDTNAIVEHLVSTDGVYARKVGCKDRAPDPEAHDALAAWRRSLLEVLAAGLVAGGPAAAKRWTPRYATRRIAWHALDHAWEIEDKSEPG